MEFLIFFTDGKEYSFSNSTNAFVWIFKNGFEPSEAGWKEFDANSMDIDLYRVTDKLNSPSGLFRVWSETDGAAKKYLKDCGEL